MNGAPTTQAEQAVRKPEGLKTPERAADSQLESVFDAQGPSGLIEMGKQEIETVSKEIDMMSQPDPEAVPDAPSEVAELASARDQARTQIDQAFGELKQEISSAGTPATAVVEQATEPTAVQPEVPIEVEVEEPVSLAEVSPSEIEVDVTPLDASIEENEGLPKWDRKKIYSSPSEDPVLKKKRDEALRQANSDLKSRKITDFDDTVRHQAALERNAMDEFIQMYPEKAGAYRSQDEGIEQAFKRKEGFEERTKAESGQEVEIPVAGEMNEPIKAPEVEVAMDWEGAITQEKSKLEAAKADYEEANRVYQDYVSKNPKPWTPIQQKYAKAMETQIAMDEAAWKQADNQIALYGASRDIEVLAKSPVEGSNTGAKLDALIADRNAKDAMTASLAAETEKMKTAHDAALADYMHQLDLVQGGESEEDAVVGGGPAVVERMPEAQTASRQAGSNAMPEAAAPPKSPTKKPGLFGRLAGAIDKQVKKDLGAVVKPVSSMSPIEQAKQDTERLMGKSEQ